MKKLRTSTPFFKMWQLWLSRSKSKTFPKLNWNCKHTLLIFSRFHSLMILLFSSISDYLARSWKRGSDGLVGWWQLESTREVNISVRKFKPKRRRRSLPKPRRRLTTLKTNRPSICRLRLDSSPRLSRPLSKNQVNLLMKRASKLMKEITKLWKKQKWSQKQLEMHSLRHSRVSLWEQNR